eukprot:6205086-Pleurochrysis_carterae.AAC.5
MAHLLLTQRPIGEFDSAASPDLLHLGHIYRLSGGVPQGPRRHGRRCRRHRSVHRGPRGGRTARRVGGAARRRGQPASARVRPAQCANGG